MAGRKRSSDELSIGEPEPGEVQSDLALARRHNSDPQQAGKRAPGKAHEALNTASSLRGWEEDLLALGIGKGDVWTDFARQHLGYTIKD